MDSLGALQQLAHIDRSQSLLAYSRDHLPEHAELLEVDQQVATLGGEYRELDAVRRPLVERCDAIESLIQQQRKRRDELSTRLASSTGAGRELEAMAGEIAHLDASLDSLESEELEILEELEPLDDQVQRIKSAAQAKSERRAVLVNDIATAQAQHDSELADLRSARSEIIAQIPVDVLKLYEGILLRVHDVAAVEVVDGVCGGCKIAAVAKDVGRWRSSTIDSLVSCPECSRIWIPAS